MKIALLLRADADDRPGGDVVQARAVARYLREDRMDVQELRGWRPSLTGFDAAVVMNLTVPEQAWLHAAACRRAGVPYLLLPVFWDLASAIPGGQRPTASALLPVGSRRRESTQRLRLLAGSRPALATAGWDVIRYVTRSSRQLIAAVVEGAAAVLPNSVAERDHLAEFIGMRPTSHWAVAHNGIWVDELPDLDAALTARRDDVILSVGAISPRKNTLGLVRAASQLRWPVQVVGPHPHSRDAYARRVFDEAPSNVEFIGLRPRDEVLRRLARARVHVQPGFVETPGLASLEAAALGTPVVVSDTPPVREYFADDASYADPSSVPSLVAALRDAWDRPADRDLAERVRRCYDWPVALAPVSEALRAL